MATVARRILVAFEGDGSGVDELAWGQRDMWLTMERQRSWLPMGGSKPLPPGTTVEDVVAELGYLMSRYQSMRTKLVLDADGGMPRQEVSASGEIVLEVIDAGEDDPYEAATETTRRYHYSDYDFTAEWPVRMGVVLRHGVPTHLAVIMCHLVTDGFGAGVMISEVEAGKAGPVEGMQALEQVEWQRSSAGKRQNDAALRHWEGLLRSIPPDSRSHASADPREPRHWMGVLDSPALHLAVQAVAAAEKVDTSLVLLTAYAVALERTTGVNPVVIRPTVNNRFRSGLGEVVCTVAQHGLCVVDVAGVPFREALLRTRKAAMTAYKHAYYDPADVQELAARLDRERGYEVETEHFFNDRRTAGRGRPGATPTPEQVTEALPLTSMRWTAAQDDPFEPLMVHVDDVPDTSRITIFMDTHVLSPKDAEALLRDMEDAAVAAALEPTA